MFDLARPALVAILAGMVATSAPAPPAAADWRDDMISVKVGVVAEAGAAYTRLRLDAFRLFLEARSEVPVELVVFPDYPALIDAHATGRTDIAIHTASSYAATARRCACIEPVAAPISIGGELGFHALLLARASSGIDDLATIAGKRLAVTATDSIAGYLAPIHALEGAGVDVEDDLGALVIAADPVDAVTMLLTGEADAAVAWSSLAGDVAAGYSFGSLRAMVDDGTLAMADVKLVWQSPLIRFGPHAVRSDLPAELKILLLDSLLSLAGEAPGILEAVDRSTYGGGGFRPAGAGDYRFVADVMAAGAR